MKKTIYAVFGAATVVFGISSACAQTSDTVATPKIAISDGAAPNIEKALTERELAIANAPVKSRHDLNQYVYAIGSPALDSLPDEARRDFVESLTFNEKGLTGFRYDILEKHLSPSEIYGLMSLFGMQHTAYMMDGASPRTSLDRSILRSAGGANSSTSIEIGDGDHEGYRCESRATCARSISRICTSNC